jgi:L-amino acid N-acyltransferase YncA
MPVDVRDAVPDDADAIVTIFNAIIATGLYTVFDTPLTAAFERDYILNLPARGVFHVAEDGEGAIVGFQSMEPFASYTHAFDHVGVLGTYVDLGRRRQGIATRLFEATFRSAVQKDYEKIFTFVRADNDAAMRTYSRQGFRTVGTARRHARIAGRYVDEIIIEKQLTS